MQNQPGGTNLDSEPCTQEAARYTEAFKLLFSHIGEYQSHLGYPEDNLTLAQTMEAFRSFCLAIQAETTELLDSMPWKPWRPEEYKAADYTNCVEEMIDIIFFMNNIRALFNIPIKEFGQILDRKLTENYRRLSIGYNKTADENKV